MARFINAATCSFERKYKTTVRMNKFGSGLRLQKTLY